MLREILESVQKKPGIYAVRIIANFVRGSIVKQDMDVIFVLSDSEENAKKLAEKNKEVIADMFKSKILQNKKPAMRKKENYPIKVGSAKLTEKNSFRKVLTDNNRFEQVSL